MLCCCFFQIFLVFLTVLVGLLFVVAATYCLVAARVIFIAKRPFYWLVDWLMIAFVFVLLVCCVSWICRIATSYIRYIQNQSLFLWLIAFVFVLLFLLNFGKLWSIWWFKGWFALSILSFILPSLAIFD